MSQYLPNIEFIIVDSTTANVTGYLEIEDITNFPLALTYSIKDVQDPQSSKGSFSKTFKLPATEHNNTILKNLYSDSLYETFQYVEDQDVQIFVDGMLVLQGKFQVKGTEYKGIPQYYEANVYGANYKWVNALAELNLCDIDFSAGNFFPNAPLLANFGRQAIMDTWQFGVAGETIGGAQTHIVYPLVNTGQWNNNNFGDAFVAPSDMMPSFYFYNMLKCIFGAQGYTLESEFFETDWFKRLVSLLPKEKFQNSDAVIEQYSFEYESTQATDWKTPFNYFNASGGAITGNNFDGGLMYSGVVCPTCDPSGLITSQNLTPKFDPASPTNWFALSTTNEKTVAGWWAFSYYDYRFPYFLPNPCGSGNQIVGWDWDCIRTTVPTGGGAPNILNGYTINTDTFQTDFLGRYIFNGSLKVEMDNAYVLNNPVSGDDPAPYFVNPNGTADGGVGISPCYGSQSFQGTTEQEWNGCTYIANAYLVHYKESTGRWHLIHVDSHRIYEPSNQCILCSNYYCNTYPLTASPNLEFKLDWSNVQLDILSVNDKVFVYTEVTMERWHNEDTGYSFSQKVASLCQTKYRITSSEFNGSLSPEIIEGGSVNLASLLPCDTTQLDWINGLTGLFNLFWQSDEQSKVVTVEPRDNFIQPATSAIDWTDKLDKGQTEKSTFVYDALQRNLCFTYTNDGADGFVEERNRRRGQQCELGSHSMNLGELYNNEDQQIGSEFYAPTYMFYDRTISTNNGAYKQPFVPVIHGEYNALWNNTSNVLQPEKVVDFAPRILIWYGYQPLNQNDGSTNANTWKWGFDDNTSPYQELTRYPFAGVYCDQNGNLGGSLQVGAKTFDNPSLYFENSAINATGGSPPYANTSGLYDMFWEFNILTILERPRIKTVFMKLTSVDIASLNFRKLIYIESAQSGTYWIINKIIDYKVGKNNLTQVELFQYANARPLKTKFPQISTGFGGVLTPFDSDFIAVLVSDGKITNNHLNTTLGIYTGKGNAVLTTGVNTPTIKGNALNYPTAVKTNYFDDGTQAPVNAKFNQSANIGNNKNFNIGATTIGNNITANKSGNIIIGGRNNPHNNQEIQLTSGNRTAVGINGGMFLEGGGGVVYYEDATTGRIEEVVTGIEIFEFDRTATKKYTFARVVKENENIV
jgi:hypothetical protein